MSEITPELIALAARTTQKIRALKPPKATQSLKQCIDASQVFTGIVPDETGGHTILIKGKALLEKIAADKVPVLVIEGAIFVTCDEEAIAMRMVLGDGEIDMPTLQ